MAEPVAVSSSVPASGDSALLSLLQEGSTSTVDVTIITLIEK